MDNALVGIVLVAGLVALLLSLVFTLYRQRGARREHARLFAQEQKRTHYLEFLNRVSKIAISSQNSELMLAEIVSETQRSFDFEHIGIGVLDYVTKEIEIKAEAGTISGALGKRIPLASAMVGRAARSDHMALVQSAARGPLLGMVPDARSVICLPLTYGDTVLGVLNVESRREDAFAGQEVLALNMLADLLATALHNTLVFQKMQHQSITDSLTGIKTRRYFLEALQSEWKRATRSGRPFAVLMIDMDRFKEVNDNLGHLEGDLVLARVARLLEQKSRHSNVVARYGGDEFIILMPETTLDRAQVLAERLRLWIVGDAMLRERRITGSFGVAAFPVHATNVEELLRVADAGMYASKRAGGNRVSTAEDAGMPEATARRQQMLTSFVAGFVQRELMGLESAEELISTLLNLRSDWEHNPQPLLDAIGVLAHAVETREVHFSGHGELVARHAQSLARELGLTEKEIAELGYAGRVHDVGKIVIPEKILCKPTPLSNEEYGLLKLHATIGARIMEAVPDGSYMAEAVWHHHEHFDGRGYPDGLADEQIPLGARILCVADAYANMITERPFAPAISPQAALAELLRHSGTHFDPAVAQVFVRIMGSVVSASSAD